ncbi:DUF1152 domain-containing protein [Nocardioides panzhihuensis]|uniref:DUF1152 domain-containing protein n=1 Tax=Nocardioides panzhihuensis TaxID=860243 RepID=A0A7Z0DHC6_9ACTN|nr:hypothetical protein [Nocardioides panzhihuensis]
MSTLYVASGGGGDALGALLARRVLEPDAGSRALVSTCAWERLRIDPVPGPRSRGDFIGLRLIDGVRAEISTSADTLPSGRSVLPRLAGDVDARLVLHDFAGGAIGLGRQLTHFARALGVDALTVVDVGGDIVARGDEAGLLSPLADSLTLAAALDVDLPVRLAVLGPGVDGELSAEQVTAILRDVGGKRAGALVAADVDRFREPLSWHPTEATTLAAAAAYGLRGAVEMRRGHAPVPVTEESAAVWLVEDLDPHDFPLARALRDTRSLGSAESIIRTIAVDELDYERRRARQRREEQPPPLAAAELARAGLARGASHITTRRLLDATSGDVPSYESARFEGLGLWALDAMARG